MLQHCMCHVGHDEQTLSLSCKLSSQLYKQLVKPHHYPDSTIIRKSSRKYFCTAKTQSENKPYLVIDKCKALSLQSLFHAVLRLLLPVRHEVYFISLYWLKLQFKWRKPTPAVLLECFLKPHGLEGDWRKWLGTELLPSKSKVFPIIYHENTLKWKIHAKLRSTFQFFKTSRYKCPLCRIWLLNYCTYTKNGKLLSR
jgi:hypothetical protein